MRIGVRRLRNDGLPIVGSRIFEPARLRERVGEVVVDERVVARQAKRHAVLGHGRVELPLGGERVPEVVVGLAVVRVDAERLLELDDGLGDAAVI